MARRDGSSKALERASMKDFVSVSLDKGNRETVGPRSSSIAVEKLLFGRNENRNVRNKKPMQIKRGFR